MPSRKDGSAAHRVARASPLVRQYVLVTSVHPLVVYLYDEGLATYSEGDTFDRNAAEGFLELFGLSYRTVAQVRKRMLETK